MAEESDKMAERTVTLKTVCNDLQEEMGKARQLNKEVEATKSGVEKAQEKLDKALDRVEFLVSAVEQMAALVGKVKGHGIRTEVIIWLSVLGTILAIVDPMKLFQ